MRRIYSSNLQYGFQITPVVKKIIIINTGIFFIELLFQIVYPKLFIKGILFLGLTPLFIKKYFMIWQFVTYMFLHGNLSHIFFNMFGLWMFGSEIERALGSRRFLIYYFLTGIGAGVMNFLFSPAMNVPIIGASGALYGILLAFGLMFPNRLIYVFFLIPVKAIYLVLIYGFLEFYSSINYVGDGIAHLAHFGGMVVGFIYLLITKKVNIPWFRRKERVYPVVDSEIYDLTEIEEKMEGIIKKIRFYGFDSLTPEEKEFFFKHQDLLKKSEENDEDDIIFH